MCSNAAGAASVQLLSILVLVNVEIHYWDYISWYLFSWFCFSNICFTSSNFGVNWRFLVFYSIFSTVPKSKTHGSLIIAIYSMLPAHSRMYECKGHVFSVFFSQIEFIFPSRVFFFCKINTKDDLSYFWPSVVFADWTKIWGDWLRTYNWYSIRLFPELLF